METPTPFDLNEAIRRWQNDLGKSAAFKADNLEELASHLRASVQKLKADGHAEEEAFQIATRRIGECGSLEREFAKVNPGATWLLPVILFWIVAGLFLFQVVYSMIFGVFCLHELMDGRAFHRLITSRSTVDQIYHTFSLHYHPPRSFVPALSMVIVLVFVLGLRFVTCSWKNIGAFVRCFERPIRTALGLVVLGLLVTILPAFLPGLLSAVPSVRMRIWVPPDGLAGRAAINVALVLTMVLLARWGLRKMSPVNRPSRP